MNDHIKKPSHYNWHPSDIECKEVTDDLPRWIGDAITYIWRRNHKGDPVTDRRKAIERLQEATPARLNTLLDGESWIPTEPYEKAHTIVNEYWEIDPLLSEACWLVVAFYERQFTAEVAKNCIKEITLELLDEIDHLNANHTRTPLIYEEQ